MAVQDWSPTEINQAKEHFLSGLKIKDIADKLGRTPSSINKALSRFGIRNNTPRYNISKTPKLAPQDNAKIKLPAPKFDRNSLRKRLDNWVNFWKICGYLSTQNVCIYEKSDFGLPLEQRKFQIGHKIYSSSQLLMMANKLRVENDQQAFLVDGLSW